MSGERDSARCHLSTAGDAHRRLAGGGQVVIWPVACPLSRPPPSPPPPASTTTATIAAATAATAPAAIRTHRRRPRGRLLGGLGASGERWPPPSRDGEALVAAVGAGLARWGRGDARPPRPLHRGGPTRAGTGLRRVAPSRAAPSATTCFGSESTATGRPSSAVTSSATMGMREDPPTSSTLVRSSARRPRSPSLGSAPPPSR